MKILEYFILIEMSIVSNGNDRHFLYARFGKKFRFWQTNLFTKRIFLFTKRTLMKNL